MNTIKYILLMFVMIQCSFADKIDIHNVVVKKENVAADCTIKQLDTSEYKYAVYYSDDLIHWKLFSPNRIEGHFLAKKIHLEYKGIISTTRFYQLIKTPIKNYGWSYIFPLDLAEIKKGT